MVARLLLCGAAMAATCGTAGAVAASSHHFSQSLWTFYRYSGREHGVVNVIDNAEQVVVQRCMRRAGFFYKPAPGLEYRYDGLAALDGLPVQPGPSTPPEATLLRVERRRGFGFYEEFKTAPKRNLRQDPNYRYYESLSPAAQKRYDRTFSRGPSVNIRFPGGKSDSAPTRGCLAQAARVMYGSVALDDFRANAVVAIQIVLDNRVFARPEKRWVGCMRRRSGHSFTDPGAVYGRLFSEYEQHGPTQKLRRLEIRLALQSTRCEYQTGFAARYARATWQAIQAMPRSWYRDIVRVYNADARALKKARAILG